MEAAQAVIDGLVGLASRESETYPGEETFDCPGGGGNGPDVEIVERPSSE